MKALKNSLQFVALIRTRSNASAGKVRAAQQSLTPEQMRQVGGGARPRGGNY